MVASDEGSGASHIGAFGLVAGMLRVGQAPRLASLEGWETIFTPSPEDTLGPDEEFGRRIGLSLMNCCSIPGSIAQ